MPEFQDGLRDHLTLNSSVPMPKETVSPLGTVRTAASVPWNRTAPVWLRTAATTTLPHEVPAGPKTMAGRTQTFYPNRGITTPGKGPNLLATLAVQQASSPPAEKVIPLWHLALLCAATFFFTASAAWLFLG